MRSDRRLIAGSVGVAILAGLIVLSALLVRPGTDPATFDKGNVTVVAVPPTKWTAPISTSKVHIPTPKPQHNNPDELTSDLLKRFPSIREANVVCDGECKLVAALGNQGLGLSPFNGNLERFLVEQGYNPVGGLVLDQPGDNDTLLIIPVNVAVAEDRLGMLSPSR